MPSITNNLFDQFRLGQMNGGDVDFTIATDTIKCAIVTAAYTLDQNADEFWSDVSAAEVSGTGYTAGGNQCVSITSVVDGSGLVKVDLADPAVWAENVAGFSNGRRAIIYKDTGVEATSRLIGFSDDFGSDQGNAAGPFSVTINASGYFTAAR